MSLTHCLTACALLLAEPWALPIAESAFGSWPTPTKADGTFIAVTNRKPLNSMRLSERVKWPTSTKSMHKGSSPAALTRKNGRNRTNDQRDNFLQASEGSGSLNPTWVEWLMGFPIAAPRQCNTSSTALCRRLGKVAMAVVEHGPGG